MKALIIFFVALIGGMLYIHHSLQDGTVLKYIDQHPQETWAPRATYMLGQSYYLLQSLPEATTYFLRVAQRYPDKPIADDGYFAYLQCLDDSALASRTELASGYKAYLERFPSGHHAEMAKIRYDTYSTSAH